MLDLSSAATTQLAARAKSEPAALAELISGARAALLAMARRRWPRHARVHEDLAQAGLIVIARAVLHFEPSGGAGFWTYARRPVRREMLREFGRSAFALKIPNHAMRAFASVAGEGLDEHEIARRASTHADPAMRGAYRHVQRCGATVRQEWIDESIGEDGARTGHDVIAADMDSALDALTSTSSTDEIEAALALFAARERLVLRRSFGLDAREGATLATLAAELGLTTQRVQQIRAAAIARMRVLWKHARSFRP